MKGRVIVLDTVQGRPAAALIEDGRVVDLLLTPREPGRPGPGAVFRAIADRAVKGQGGMFLRLPDGVSAFARGVAGLRAGSSVLVQVTGFAEPGKAMPVTARLLFKGRYGIVTPDAPGLNLSRQIGDPDSRSRLLALAEQEMHGSAAGLILRSAAAGADDAAVLKDIEAMRAHAEGILAQARGKGPQLLLDGPDPHQLARRDWPAPDLIDDATGSFGDHGVLAAIEDFLGPKVALPGGASAWIEPTRALVAVDVNSGGDTSPAAGLKSNLALLRDLPRQLCCRGLGGQIVIDVAPTPKSQRQSLEDALRKALRADPVETAIAGWTPLGHLELQRKRERLALTECLLP